MKLIDREKLKNILCDQCAEIAGICQRGSCGSTRMLDSMPVVDAVPVVRCKDCKYIIDRDDGTHGCYRNFMDDCKIDDFCSRGEK